MKRLFALVLALVAGAAASSAGPPPRRTRIVLVGDSTVTDGSGWGIGFRRFLTDHVELINAAANGRSSKSYIDEGRWAQALAFKADYYLIQFGRNDEPGKGPERETDPGSSYKEYISRYVEEARAIGATPILVTSLTRRTFDANGRIVPSLTPYVSAVGEVAASRHRRRTKRSYRFPVRPRSGRVQVEGDHRARRDLRRGASIDRKSD